jgi:hypothetical protein
MVPAVGRQLTVSGEIKEADRQLIDLLMIRAAIGDCDLTGKGEGRNCAYGSWLYRNDAFYADRSHETPLRL